MNDWDSFLCSKNFKTMQFSVQQRCVCVCVCVYIYIYIFIHIYVYKYTYTFTYIKFFFPQQSRSKETPKEYLLFWLLGSQSSGAKSYMTHFTTLLIKTDVLNWEASTSQNMLLTLKYRIKLPLYCNVFFIQRHLFWDAFLLLEDFCQINRSTFFVPLRWLNLSTADLTFNWA